MPTTARLDCVDIPASDAAVQYVVANKKLDMSITRLRIELQYYVLSAKRSLVTRDDLIRSAGDIGR
jgi:hypothetical protein